MNGEWDRLLVWPCKLQADIILRDQPDNLDEVSCKLIAYTDTLIDLHGFTGEGHIQDDCSETEKRATRTEPVHFYSAQNP